MLTFAFALGALWFLLCTVMDTHHGVKGWRFNVVTAASWPATAWLWLTFFQG